MNFMTSVDSTTTSGERYESGEFRMIVFSVRTIDEVREGMERAFRGGEKGYAEHSFISSDLLWRVLTGKRDPAGEAARIDAFMLELLASTEPSDEEARIRAAHAALINDDTTSVADLAGQLGMSARSLERLSLRAFGFSPKLLLRRQRFLRSLAQFMLDPSLKWIRTLDYQYVDQAHFVRDFQRFMGMSPSRYGALEHPVLRAAAQARTAAAGQAVQALHRP